MKTSIKLTNEQFKNWLENEIEQIEARIAICKKDCDRIPYTLRYIKDFIKELKNKII